MIGIFISWWLKIPEIEFSLDMAYEPLDVTKKMWRCDQDGFSVIVSWLYIPRICSSPKFTSFQSLSRWKLLFGKFYKRQLKYFFQESPANISKCDICYSWIDHGRSRGWDVLNGSSLSVSFLELALWHSHLNFQKWERNELTKGKLGYYWCKNGA